MAPLLPRGLSGLGVPDVLALDFAPAYNFRLDDFEFDGELQAVQRAVRFTPRLHALATDAARTTFGHEPYLAAHLRRDGYDAYCAGAGGLGHYGRVRYGVPVTPEACFPSIAQVAAALHAALRRHRLRSVLLATNSIDAAELQELHATVPFRRWHAGPTAASHPEWVPLVEMLLCARAAAFVGTLPSTWSASVLVQRDLLRKPRNTTAFFGGYAPAAGPGFSPSHARVYEAGRTGGEAGGGGADRWALRV